jgi:equilibrative nucleoside transporter 1/2/3
MILQAAPYFHRRFQSNPWILRNFQAYNLVIFALAISIVTISFKKGHIHLAYIKCLSFALLTYIAVSGILVLSTLPTLDVCAELYFSLLLLLVFITGVANALSQQAAFAFVARFGRTEYAPALMVGEALAGLLPSVIGRSKH